MVNAKELRLGNYIRWRHPIMGWANVEVIGDAIQNCSQFPNSYEPHPLTKELLTEWCGFEERQTTIYLEKNEILFRYKNEEISISGIFEGDESIYPKNMQYLHQLQNLFFALTGTELLIKIPA